MIGFAKAMTDDEIKRLPSTLVRSSGRLDQSNRVQDGAKTVSPTHVLTLEATRKSR